MNEASDHSTPSLNNPVVSSLLTSIKQNNLSHRWLECVIEAKMNELNSSQHSDISEMEDHYEKSHSSLLYLLLESMGIRHEESEYMASHVGVCFGIISHLRGTAYFLSQVLYKYHFLLIASCCLIINFVHVYLFEERMSIPSGIDG